MKAGDDAACVRRNERVGKKGTPFGIFYWGDKHGSGRYTCELNPQNPIKAFAGGFRRRCFKHVSGSLLKNIEQVTTLRIPYSSRSTHVMVT